MTRRMTVACSLSLLLCLPALAAPEAYRLRDGDSLNVTVLGHAELSVQGQAIRPDGRLSLPLVPEVGASGLSVPELGTALTRAYRSYLANPQVVVSIARLRPLKVTVLGQVQHPGTFDFEDAPSLVDAVARAGGLTDRAERQSIQVRTPAGASRTYDLDRLLSGQEQLPLIAEGTVIEVRETWGPDWYRIIPVLSTAVTAGALLFQVLR